MDLLARWKAKDIFPLLHERKSVSNQHGRADGKVMNGEKLSAYMDPRSSAIPADASASPFLNTAFEYERCFWTAESFCFTSSGAAIIGQ